MWREGFSVYRIPVLIAGTVILGLTGCGKTQTPPVEERLEVSGVGTEPKNVDESVEKSTGESIEESTDEAMQESRQNNMESSDPESVEEDTEKDSAEEAASLTVPQLPEWGETLADFVPEGWKLLDSGELDFNGDEIPDYVGVLEAGAVDTGEYAMLPDCPRILFAIASAESGRYRLDFQDINLIRTRNEGGVFGDPYLPLEAEGTSFITHTYGGSAWRWAEDRTYTYRDGIWYLALSEDTYGYGPYVTSYTKDDWESGVGIRKRRSDAFEDIERGMEESAFTEAEEYELVYEVMLNEAPTLKQAGQCWWLAPDRVTDWEVKSVELAENVEIPASAILFPNEAHLRNYCDENRVLYTFSDTDTGKYYIAMYLIKEKLLSVAAESDTVLDDATFYEGKIYFSSEIVEQVVYGTMQDGKEQLTEEEDTVGIRLNRVNPDGTERETIFEYRYREEESGIRRERVPYLALIYEAGGDEIVAEVYVGDEPHLFYRMKIDGSKLQFIGQVPAVDTSLEN